MRKNLKKGLAILLAGAMMFSLIGCSSGKDKDKGSATEQPTATEEAKNDATEEPSDATEEPEGEFDYHTLFPGGDLGGKTIRLLATSNLAALNPDEVTEEPLEDYKIEERRANVKYIEEKYNCKLEFVSLEGAWDDQSKELSMAYAAGKPLVDVMDLYLQHLGAFTTNDILYDATELVKTLPILPEYYGAWNGRVYGPSLGMGGEGIFYNYDLINKAGMEKTPAQMFDEGRWSYDDFYEYCKELKSKLGEDEYPLLVSPGYWLLFAPAANGETIMADDGLHLTSAAMLETMEFYQKLVKDGLISIPPLNEAGKYDNWTHGGKFDAGAGIAMAHRAGWQVASINSGFQIGFVPYPWGSNVTIEKTGEPGSYLTLSDNYKATFFDGQLLSLRKGIEEVGDPGTILMMTMELMDWSSTMEGYVAPVTSEADRDTKWFDDELDVDLYYYSMDIERWEPYNSINFPEEVSNAAPLNKTFYEDGSVRSVFETKESAESAYLKEAGMIK